MLPSCGLGVLAVTVNRQDAEELWGDTALNVKHRTTRQQVLTNLRFNRRYYNHSLRREVQRKRRVDEFVF